MSKQQPPMTQAQDLREAARLANEAAANLRDATREAKEAAARLVPKMIEALCKQVVIAETEKAEKAIGKAQKDAALYVTRSFARMLVEATDLDDLLPEVKDVMTKRLLDAGRSVSFHQLFGTAVTHAQSYGIELASTHARPEPSQE